MDIPKLKHLLRPLEKSVIPSKEPPSRKETKKDLERAQLVLLSLRLQLDQEPKK
jgi:hypothetical protein